MVRKKALLLGGTGAMGVYLIPELIKKNYQVYVTSRTLRKSSDSNLVYLQGNAHDIAFLDHCLSKQWDAIVDFMIYSTEEFRSRVDLLLSSTKHYLFLSTYRVFADSSQPITEYSPRLLDICEDQDYLETDEYALTKARQENILRKHILKNWTILRPSITYSKNRFQLATLEAESVILRSKLKLPVAVAESILNKKTTMTWAGDVGFMIASLTNNEAAFSEDFNVVTCESKYWYEIASIYQECAELNLFPVDYESYSKIVDNQYQIKYDRMYNRVMDNSKILNFINITQDQLKSVIDGLSEEVEYGLVHANSLEFNYSLQGRMDKIVGSKIPLTDANLKNKVKYYLNYINTKRSWE